MADISRLDALMPQITAVAGKPPVAPVSSGNGDSFSELLKNALSSVNDAQTDADEARRQVISGESTDIQNTMIALQKADVSLKMMLEVRNKILEAYQEVLRTQM